MTRIMADCCKQPGNIEGTEVIQEIHHPTGAL